MNSERPAIQDGPADKRPDPFHRPSEPPGVKSPETTPAEERGERLDTGKIIAHGGKTDGPVPGAEPSPPSRDAG